MAQSYCATFAKRARRRINLMRWQLKLAVPGCIFAVQCDDYQILSTAYLSSRAALLPPQNALAQEAARQIHAYLHRPRGFVFSLPLLSAKTAHQRRTRTAVQSIVGGDTQTYGAIAKQINSSARAVGGACRANAVPLIVPCHRVVAAAGVGGFMGAPSHRIKQCLLRHENQ